MSNQGCSMSRHCSQLTTLFNEDDDITQLTWWIHGLSTTCEIKFKDFETPVLFSSTCTFKALNLGEKIPGPSRMRGNIVLSSSVLCVLCSKVAPHIVSSPGKIQSYFYIQPNPDLTAGYKARFQQVVIWVSHTTEPWKCYKNYILKIQYFSDVTK